MNDKKMLIGTGMTEIHLEFASIQEKREWLIAIDECKKRLNFGRSAIVSDEIPETEEIKSTDAQLHKPIR